jgi:glyoxylase-like metal-dependent hydrolase (beta-lactamase superfamily II)
MRFYLLHVLAVAAALCSFSNASESGQVATHKVAEGVYLFSTTGYGDVGLCGNSVAIVSDDSVLVFDSGGIPETAQTILAEIRKLTPKPVRYLVNSHWHWDHWGGNQVYRQAFPSLEIITHQNTLRQMLEVEPAWNDEGLKTGLPGYIAQLEKKLEKDRASHAPEEQIRNMEELLQADRSFLAAKTSLHKTYPDVTFSDALTVFSGTREIRIQHARAITPGDTWLWLPQERILVTGDVLINPYPFAVGGTYPAGWLATLEELAALDPAVIIPGHGEAVEGKALLQKNIRLFQETMRQVKEARTQGATIEATVDSVGKRASELAAIAELTDPRKLPAFRAYFLDVFVRRAWRELEHPLTDSPK